MDQEIRNKLRNVVTQCRKLLEEAIAQELEGKYGIFAKKDQVTADPSAKMTHLTDEEQAARKDILDHYAHIKARGFKPKDALDQLIREIAFTHLNRLCAYKMMEAREVYVGGQKFREAVSRGVNSNGVKFYLAEHPEEERLFNTGQQDVAYRHFLDWLGGALSDEIGVLFNPSDPANRLYPRQKTLDEVLDLLNGGGIKAEEAELREQWPQIWSQDESIGWVYQFFTPKELREKARRESSTPRTSYELAFRNQFFTPRYVVEFLTDNTLGRIWYEMRKGDTKLKDECNYMVRRPTEVFLNEGEQPTENTGGGKDGLSQQELLKQPVNIPHRPKKDPRELKILDPACGSGHFLLYCFDLLLTIYEEAYADPDLRPALQRDYPNLDDLRRDVPRLILAHNLHGIDIDLRASQIAALALWLRCQRAYQEMGLKKDRPQITRSNFVCAEPMPGEEPMLKEFVGQLEPKVLGQVVEAVFDKMKLAGEAGSLLKIEDEIREAVAAAKKQFVRETTHATDKKGRTLLFTEAEMERLAGKPELQALFDVSDITDDQFFEQAEVRVISALSNYVEKAHNGLRLQRRLFSEDAVRGFSFIDVLQHRYDVVLMNPPFGADCESTAQYLKQRFPSSHDDLAYAFIDRTLSLMQHGGLVGALTTRTGFFLPTFSDWRVTSLAGGARISVCADLGYGVLDALVETAAYVVSPSKGDSLVVFVDLLKEIDKRSAMESALSSSPQRIHVADASSFSGLPGTPFAYWAPSQLLAAFERCKTFEPTWGLVKRGVATGDNERFLRLFWEVPADNRGTSRRWIWYAKGGEYSPYYISTHLVLDWDNDGFDLKNFTDENGRLRSRPQNLEFFFQPGLAYASRTTSAFGPRVLPAGHGFDQTSNPIFMDSGVTPFAALVVLMTRPVQAFVELTVGSGDTSQSGTAARDYTNGLIGTIPVPQLTEEAVESLDKVGRELVDYARCESVHDETTIDFCGLRNGHASVRGAVQGMAQDRLSQKLRMLELTFDAEKTVSSEYGLTSEGLSFLDDFVGRHPCSYTENKAEGDTAFTVPIRQETKKCYWADRSIEVHSHQFRVNPTVAAKENDYVNAFVDNNIAGHAKSIVSYCIGVAFGRWDVRTHFAGSSVAGLPSPLSELPLCAPAMLQTSDGFPAKITPQDYPLGIKWDGVLVEDAGHESDIVRRCVEVCEMFGLGDWDKIEEEVCGLLSVPNLRAYFRKPSKGGFWDDHIARYSKSRRKAPIYWLLQSSKKNYAIWLYYHRLDKDLLFKALVNYVEPKIRMETSRLESLRTQKATAGESGKEAKRLAKDVERQEEFLSELQDFEDKLRRAANLHLEPDLNDGVVLNIAPLWELVPWKEAKKYWDELMEGQYVWSSIGKQLRHKGLVKQ
jgi:hypothetical protein